MAVTLAATPRPARLGAELFEISREAGAAPADHSDMSASGVGPPFGRPAVSPPAAEATAANSA
jgi:hypothetical protein